MKIHTIYLKRLISAGNSANSPVDSSIIGDIPLRKV